MPCLVAPRSYSSLSAAGKLYYRHGKLALTIKATHHYDGSPIWHQLSQKASRYRSWVGHSGVIVECPLTFSSSPMSFFATTDTGVTLNRFSQDLQLIDMELPVAALNTFASQYPV